jgi:hypothetical protein
MMHFSSRFFRHWKAGRASARRSSKSTGKEIAEAFQAFKKLYLTVVDQFINHLTSHEADEPTR